MEKNKVIAIWTAISLLALGGIAVSTHLYPENKDIVTIAIGLFLSCGAVFMFDLVIRGIKTGTMHFGMGGPYSKSRNERNFWISVVGAAFLGGVFLYYAVKTFVMLG